MANLKIGVSENQALQMTVPAVTEMALGAPQRQNQLVTIAERTTPSMGANKTQALDAP